MISLAVVLLAGAAAAPPESRPPASARDRGQAYYHFSLGLQARLLGDTDAALAEYRKAGKLDPASAVIRVETARLLRDSARFEEALLEAKQAVALEPDLAEAHLVLGQLHQSQSDGSAGDEAVKLAAAEFEEVVRLQPNDLMTLQSLAGLYAQLQQPADAVRAWERYIALDPGSFDAHVQLGAQLLSAGESDRAAVALQKAVELQPSSARAYAVLGEIYARAQQVDQAILNYRKALELDPGGIRIRLSLGETLLRAKRPQEALAEAKAVLEGDARNRLALDLAGRCHRELRQFDDAIAAADKLLALDPTDVKAQYLKVTVAEARRDYATAATLLEGLLARNRRGEEDSASNDRVFLVHLGFAHQQQGKYTEAAAAFGRAKATGGEPDSNLMAYEAEALYLAKDYDRALAETKAARARFPDDPDLGGLEAAILRTRGDLPGALAVVDAKREKAPTDLRVLAQVAQFYQRAKRYPEAEAALRKSREIKPRDLGTLFQLGAVLERQKRFEDAEKVFREALAVDADAAPVLNYLGYMNADRDVRVEEAARLIERALAIDPENGAYLDSLGWAQYRLGKLESAEQNVRKALAKQPDNAVILDHLADVLKRRGRVAEAVELWRKALAGEDEDGELDRSVVEAKVRDAQTWLAKNP
jgi:tetratricopeptide (TPR) repeat protein